MSLPPRSLADFSLAHFSLEGRVAIVTGGNSGLGQALTVALAAAGADLFVASTNDDGGETAALVAAHGRRMVELRVDLTTPGAPAQIVKECLTAFGSLDILVNSAGVLALADIEEFGRDEWDRMVSVNLTAPFELAHEVAPLMVEQGSGKIINVASLFSFLGGRGSPAYAATKHGIAGFTKAYCDELAGHNVQVNAIAPGYFATRMTEATRSDPDHAQRILEHVPAGRWGDPQDLMGATVFLSSAASDYVNGHVLTVDGGYLVR